MDSLWKFAITASGAMLVLLAGQRCGPRIAGLIAALPIVTAPALVWLAHEHGVRFAAGAAVGSTAACAMLAIFAWAFWAGLGHGSATALAAGSAAALLMALPVLAVGGNLALSVALAVACSAVAHGALPAREDALPIRPASLRRMAGAAFTVGASTAALAALGPMLGDVLTGLLSSLPLIGAAAAVLEHARGGRPASTEFLRGYVDGLFAKAAFGVVFALVAPQAGSGVALALACASAVLLSWASQRAPARSDASALLGLTGRR